MMRQLPPEELAGRLLVQHGLTVATAESCTGGLVCHCLTNVSGSSDYVLGGIIAYSNEVKVELLDVDPLMLEQYGAVSEPTALAMARGARRRLGADVVVSTTGIAGPTGGTPDKPVGLVYIGLVTTEEERCERYCRDWGNRCDNKHSFAEQALSLLIAHLEISLKE